MAQGRGNAKAILCMIALLAFSHAVAAKDVVVGGSAQEWNYPPGTDTTFYDTWSTGIKFAVGDNLLFQYQAGAHDVQMVSASEYSGCLSSSNAKLTSGNDKVPLAKAGDYYFICTFPTHCDSGMKVKVTVGAAAPPATPPATPPAPAIPPPAPTPVIVAPVPAPVLAPSIAPTPVPEVAPPTSVPVPSPPVEEPAPAPTESPTTSPAPAPGSAHSVRVGFGVVGAAVVAAIGALLF